MRLADFIESHITEIVDEAEAFAKSLDLVGERLDSVALRDHIPDMLKVMVVDLRTTQTDAEARLKSEGRAAPTSDLARTAAQTHAGTRANQGFDVIQLVSEYRVLRASILRLWTKRHKVNSDTIDDINRFNEAVDQAIAESVGTFAAQIDQWRNVFLGILGHELRGPLSAILLASEMLGSMDTDAPVAKNVARIISGGERMRALLNDLLDFNRVSFGLGLLIHRAPVDLAHAGEHEIDLIRTTWPKHEITFRCLGDVSGAFDESRVREVLWNLVSNAAKYGDSAYPIDVTIDDLGELVILRVRNGGPTIPADKVNELFEPLRRASDTGALDGSLGLGLFVVRQVALAHGGSVSVQSENATTQFEVTLKRGPADVPSAT